MKCFAGLLAILLLLCGCTITEKSPTAAERREYSCEVGFTDSYYACQERLNALLENCEYSSIVMNSVVFKARLDVTQKEDYCEVSMVKSVNWENIKDDKLREMLKDGDGERMLCEFPLRVLKEKRYSTYDFTGYDMEKKDLDEYCR